MGKAVGIDAGSLMKRNIEAPEGKSVREIKSGDEGLGWGGVRWAERGK